MQRRVTATLLHARHLLVCLLLLLPFLARFVEPVQAIPQVQQRFDRISVSTAGSVARHELGFVHTDFANPVGSISFEFCANSPLTDLPCVAPSGLDVAPSGLLSQSGQTGFAINGTVSTANRLVLSRTPQAPTASSAGSAYEFTNVLNPDTVGSYYVRIETFSSTDGTGLALEEGGVVFTINRAFDVSAEVPPYLRFCASVTIVDFDCASATSFFIDFGEFSKTSAKAVSSQMVVATNASSGFTISLAGTTLTSGNNLIPALTTQSASSPGTGQFGLNLRANTAPDVGANPTGPGGAGPTPLYGIPNRFRFVQGDPVVSSTTTSDNKKFTVSYLANVHTSQPGGVYATTISFIALANF